MRFNELLDKEVLAGVAAVSGLFFDGSEISVILLSVVRADNGACPFLLEGHLGVMFVVGGRPLVLLCFEGFSCSDC